MPVPEEFAAWLSALRRDFHAHPEVAFQEKRTTQRIREVLADLGVATRPLPGLATGVLAVIPGGRPGPVLALRADIDALPLEEANPVPYRSRQPGCMHACGHDGHAAILLGVAREVLRREWPCRLKGELRLIFQPAEEMVAGAARVIEAGALNGQTVSRIYALHLCPNLETGRAGFTAGPAFAASLRMGLTIHGVGAHGAMPHQGVDPILAGAHFVTAVQSILSRNLCPHDQAVVSVTSFQAGQTVNVIPETAELLGTVRHYTPEVRELVTRRLREIVAGTEATFGVRCRFSLDPVVPACRNHPEPLEALRNAAGRVLGRQRLTNMRPSLGAEDFGLYTERVPGAIFHLGCANQDLGIVHKLHSPHFDLDEAALPLGVEIFLAAIQDYLG